MTLVVDATVLVDAAGSEDQMKAWHACRVAEHVIAPGLLQWEVGNVVHHRRRDLFPFPLAQRIDIVETLLAGIDTLLPAEGDREWAARLAEKHGLTFYDAAYLATAKSLPEAALLTHDERLLAAGRKELGKTRCRRLV